MLVLLQINFPIRKFLAHALGPGPASLSSAVHPCVAGACRQLGGETVQSLRHLQQIFHSLGQKGVSFPPWGCCQQQQLLKWKQPQAPKGTNSGFCAKKIHFVGQIRPSGGYLCFLILPLGMGLADADSGD